MKTFTITANAIVTTVEAIDADAAILAYVADAGYASVADAADACGQTEADFLADISVEEAEGEDEGDDDSFRAAYCISEDGQGDMLLTTEADSDLPDADLIEAAVAAAHAIGLIGDDEDVQVSEADLRDRLRVGPYRR